MGGNEIAFTMMAADTIANVVVAVAAVVIAVRVKA